MRFFTKIMLIFNLIKYRGLFLKKQYSKNSEDQFLKKFFSNKSNGIYIDIGAYHPYRFSNTCLLHNRGWSGLNIDPNKKSIDLFNLARPNDINLNIAVGDKSMKKNIYYKKDFHPMNTLNKSFAKRFIDENIKSKKINILKVDNIFDKYLKNSKIDLLDIDVEGSEYDIIKSINYNKYKFKVILIEITNFDNKSKLNARKIRTLLSKNGYKYLKSFGETSVYKNIT